MKTIAKTETFSEFLARGGKVTKCPPKGEGKFVKPRKEKAPAKEVDMSALPMALKIAYGIK